MSECDYAIVIWCYASLESFSRTDRFSRGFSNTASKSICSSALFATRVGAFFGLDVVVSAIALFVFIFAERKRAGIRYVWVPIVATFIVGVSLGLPLFLYMRQRVVDEDR